MTKEILEEEFSVIENKKFESDISVKRKEVSVGEIYKGFNDTELEGTWAYGGLLNIRPAFQREFVYEGKALVSVIESVLRGFPLSLIYWGEEDGKFEMIDGQQRTLSIMKFIDNEFTIDVDGTPYKFEDLDRDLQEKILDYKLDVAILNGTPRTKLKYFEIINTSGMKLNQQELLNAAHTGKFVSEARKAFSNKDSEFFTTAGMGGNWTGYLKRSKDDIKRQAILERVLLWINKGDRSAIANYLANNRNNSAKVLIDEVLKILEWSKGTFAPTSDDYKDWMVDVDWGLAYYRNIELGNKLSPTDSSRMKDEVERLGKDDEVQKFTGIPMYLITGREKYLNLRTFTKHERTKMYNKQDGRCKKCNEQIPLSDAQADHIKPWSKGGKTEVENLQILCSKCNNEKSDK